MLTLRSMGCVLSEKYCLKSNLLLKRLSLPIPPFQFIWIRVFSRGEINGTYKRVEHTDVVCYTCCFVQFEVEFFWILIFQITDASDTDVPQVKSAGFANARNLLKLF